MSGIISGVLPLPKCLHINACPRIIWPHRNIHPHPVSDVGPVPPAMQAATGVFANIKSRWRSFTYLHLHSPIGEKLFLYVNHRREVTSDKISSFSKEKSQIMLSDDYYIITHTHILYVCVCVLYSNLKVHCTLFLRSTQALWSQENLQSLQIEVCHMSRWL